MHTEMTRHGEVQSSKATRKGRSEPSIVVIFKSSGGGQAGGERGRREGRRGERGRGNGGGEGGEEQGGRGGGRGGVLPKRLRSGSGHHRLEVCGPSNGRHNKA